MRITLFSNFNQPCGIADYSENLVDKLIQRVEVEKVSLPRALVGGNAPPLWWVRKRKEYYGLGRKLNGGDLCHIQHEYAFWGGFFLYKNHYPHFLSALRRPLILTAHELIVPPYQTCTYLFSRLFRSYENYVNWKMFLQPARTIVHTSEMRHLLIQRGVPAEKLVYMPLGVPDIESLGPEEGSFDKLLRLNGFRNVVLTGFVSLRKGYDLFLDVFPELPADVRFVIAGGPRTEIDRSYIEKLQEKVCACGLADRVVITGYLKPGELRSVLSLADVVVAPFDKVSGSASLSLALSAGRAIVASDLPPLADLARDSGAFLLFRKGDVFALRDALLRVLEDQSLRQVLEGNARRYANNNSISVMADKTVEIYREVFEEWQSTK